MDDEVREAVVDDARRFTLGRDLVESLRETWAARDLLYQLTVRDVRIRYKQAIMGLAWALLMPILIVLSGLVIRVAVASMAGGGFTREMVLALAVKGVGWGFFSGAMTFATASLTASSHLVSKIYFPREVLPISATLAQGFDSCIAATAIALALPWLGMQWSAALLWVPVLAILLILFTVSMGMALSCANVFFRDVKYIVQVSITFGIFFTPIFYEPSMLGARGAELIMWNPLAPLLEGARLVLGAGHNLAAALWVTVDGELILAWHPKFLLYSAAWAIGGTLIGFSLFHRAEYLFAEYV